MSIIDTVRTFLTLDMVHERDFVLAEPFDEPAPDLATQMANLRRAGVGPWRAPSVREAMGVPAIFGAVNMIANLVGSMSMMAMRNEVELPPEKRPRVIIRPDPFTIPREFYRATAYNIASRGEAWWWAAVRDSDGQAITVLNVNPAEVNVEEDPNDPRFPVITWRNKTMRNEDFRQLVYAREPGSLRGVGPLQMCGAAVSVAVEAQEWAANFYASGNSAIWVKSAVPLSGGDEDEDGLSEVQRFLASWMDKSPNTPRVSDDAIEDIKTLDINPQGAQMLDARMHQNIDVATMFNMDAELLNAAVAGTSLTYQNTAGRFDNFVKMCLRPNYLEVMEQTMSDFLTRSTVARFNTSALTMADTKTRWEVYNLALPVLGPEETLRMTREGEGLSPGDVENAPVPFSPPAAIPSASAFQERSELRCDHMMTKRRNGIARIEKCGKLLMAGQSYCPRCKSPVEVAS